MVIKCCVYICRKTYKRQKVGDENNNAIIMFHCFPKNTERKTKWVNNIREINGSTWEPKNTSFVCSEHFDESSWESIREDRKCKLKSAAIPSVFNNTLTSKVTNDHTYSMQRSLQDSNKNDITCLSAKRKKLRVSCDSDHTYVRRQPMCSNGLEIIDSLVEETIFKDKEQNETNTLKIETSCAVNEIYDTFEESGYSALDVLIPCLEKEQKSSASIDAHISKDIFHNSVKETTSRDEGSLATISSKSQQKNVINSSGINSVFIDSIKPTIALNNLDIVMQSSKEKSTCSHTLTRNDNLDILSNWVAKVKNDISIPTVTEQNTVLQISTLRKKNEQLKKHLTKLNIILNMMRGQNQVLRNSNKNMCNQLNTWKNFKKKEEKFKILTLSKENEQLKKRLTKLNTTLDKILGKNQVLRNSNKNMYKQLNTWKNFKKKEKKLKMLSH